MAEGSGDLFSMSLEKLDAELTCPVCTEHFKEPKVLPCLHYYCKTCIADLIKRANGKPFNCPECCIREAQAAGNDPESFPTAFFVNRMEEVFSIMKKAEPKEGMKCESCSQLPVINFCHDCNHYICSNCSRAHKMMSVLSSHEVVSVDTLRSTISKGTPEKLQVVRREVKCSKHEDEPLKLYCRDCHKLVCRDCILIDHKDHNYAFVTDTAPLSKGELEERVDEVRLISVGLRSAQRSLVESRKIISDHSIATMILIDDAVDKVVAKLEQKKAAMKAKATQIIDRAKNEIDVQEKNAELAVGEVESLVEFMNRTLERATDQEVLSLEKQMSDQMERVSQLYGNPADMFPVPTLPELVVQCGDVINEAIEMELSIASESVQQCPNVPASSFVQLKDQQVIKFCTNRKLTLKKGNLAAEKADILVNAADPSLYHDGGVAGALNSASKGALQRLSSAYMKMQRKGKLIPAGEVVVTGGGGDLKCTNVIHVVGPEGYRHSSAECARLVTQVVSNTLAKAEKLNVASIVFPAISCGRFGVENQLVARCIIDSILGYTYTKPVPVLADIRIVILTQSTYSCFAKYLQQMSHTLSSGQKSGVQPSGGTILYKIIPTPLCGYEGFKTIQITYTIPGGIQGLDHPSPGHPFTGSSMTAYLPFTEEGWRVFKLLEKAFRAGMIFKIGTFTTTGAQNTVIWDNSISHKTIASGRGKYGYPDSNYLQRVTQELAARGIS